MNRQTTVKNLPRTAGVAGGGETKKGDLKENADAMTRETNVKALPQATIVGRDKKAKTNTQWKGGTQPTVPRGGEVRS